MAIALVTHATAVSPGASSATTSGVDTSGANLLVVVGTGTTSTEGTISDSKSNTWNALSASDGNDVRCRIWYAVNPTVGSAHTFTKGASGTFSSIMVLAFSGADTSSPFDQQNGNSGTSLSSLAAGSVTPSTDGQVVVTGLGFNAVSSITVPSGYTITDTNNYSAANNYGGSAAYKIQTTATATNPSWSMSNTCDAAARVATFKAAAGGGGTETLMAQGMM